MATAHSLRAVLLRTCVVAAFAAVVSACVGSAHGAPLRCGSATVNRLELHYRANGGTRRIAYLELPGWYGPGDNPPLPLVIAPHGTGAGPFLELPRAWGDLAARGPFAIVFPEGQGRELAHYS